MNLWEDHPDVAPLTFHPRVGQAAAELLGVPTRSGSGTTRRSTSEAGGRVTDPHQDHPYWPIKETASVTAWIPFEGSTLAVGCDGLPAGHATPSACASSSTSSSANPRTSSPTPRSRASSRCSSRCRRVASRSTTDSPCTSPTPNTTDRDRAVHTIIYFPDGSTRGYPFPHFAVDRGGIEVGDAIDSDVDADRVAASRR